jgi:hypothetical protein
MFVNYECTHYMVETKKRTSLYTLILERVADQLRDSELRETFVNFIVDPILQSSVLRRLRVTLYAILTLLFVMLTLLIIQTVQITLYIAYHSK